MIQFADPLWLWGLAGVIVPFAIHLLSRREGRTIPFGSLRFLEETPSSRFRGIRLNEVLLLLVRCFCIVVLVLFLAGFSIKGESAKQRILLVEDEAANIPRLSALLDSLAQAGYEMKTLSEQFKRNVAQSRVNYWTVVEDLSRQPYESVIIIGSPLFKNFRGERVKLPDHIQFIPIPDTNADTFELFTTYRNGPGASRIGYTGRDATRFETIFRNTDNAAGPADSIRVRILWDAAHAREKDWFVAALNAASVLFKPIVLRFNNDNAEDHIDWNILLTKEGPIPKENVILLGGPFHPGVPLFYPDSIGGNVNNAWIFNPPPDIGKALENEFVIALSKIVIGNEMEELAEQNDRRLMPEKMMWSSGEANLSGKILTRANEAGVPWLLLLFVAGLFAERILSKYRRQ